MPPSSFFFFVETMSIHFDLTTSRSGIGGISLPIPNQEVLEVEFADDTGFSCQHLEGGTINQQLLPSFRCQNQLEQDTGFLGWCKRLPKVVAR